VRLWFELLTRFAVVKHIYLGGLFSLLCHALALSQVTQTPVSYSQEKSSPQANRPLSQVTHTPVSYSQEKSSPQANRPLSQPAERLSLKEAIDIALQQNPEITGARRSIDAASARFWRGISPPTASLSVGYDYIPTGSAIKDYGERFVGVSQSFDFPTTIALRGSSLSSEISATEADFHSTALSITMQAKLAYYAVLAKEQKLKLAGENLDAAEDFADKAGIRYKAGEGTNLEQLTAKVQHTQARNTVELARNELRLATSELNFALGRGKEQPREFALTDSLMHRTYALSLDSLVQQADQNNPQLQSASFRLNAASVNRTIAWSSILPGFTVSYSRQAQGGNPNLYGVAFGISVPIWFLFDQRGQIQEASATHAILESDLTAKRNFVILDVKSAYLEFKNDERQVQLYHSELLPQADEVYRTAATSHQAGEITYMEFLQARQTLISARSTYIDALYHYNAAIAHLEKAVGRTIGE
jgi:cobalt-zinc-cadmium efflux system outer membrane protein